MSALNLSASLILILPTKEILTILRPATMRNFPGSLVFPGGRVELPDVDQVSQKTRIFGLESEMKRCALRETFEETGLLKRYVKNSALSEHALERL